MNMETAAVIDCICETLNYVVKESLADNKEILKGISVPIKKKSKDLIHGDIVVPHFLNEKEGEKVARKILDQAKDRLLAKAIPVRCVTQDDYNILSFHLDRPAVFRLVLEQVLEQGDKYGYCNKGQGHDISLLPFVEMNQNTECIESAIHFRISVAILHLKRLLEACGYKVNAIPDLKHTNQSTKISSSDSSSSSTHAIFSDDHSHLRNQLDNLELNEGVLDLAAAGVLQKFCTGKEGLDKNLTRIDITTKEGEITNICKLAATQASQIKENTHTHTINVVPQSHTFHLQQIITLQTAVSKTIPNQSYLTVGPIVCKENNSLMSDFKRLRYNQMKEASEMRHGIKCEGPEWEMKINQLTESWIKIEMLGTALHCPLKMNFDSNSKADNRLGPFVLYNTARLASILNQFELEIEKGTYPPLPALEKVNFTLLREQEEWELLFLNVAMFPCIVSESVEVVVPEQGKLAAKIHTHRITNFLISFSKSLSSYYSRYHILGGPEPHLLPLMFARLHLVKACHTVLVNALQLLDIQPFDEL